MMLLLIIKKRFWNLLNKRVGIAVMLLLLKLNGYTLQYSQEELILMGISIADGSMDELGIKEWIDQHKKT